MSLASPCSAMSFATLKRPRRPHGSQTIPSVGPRTSDRVSAPSRGMGLARRAGGSQDARHALVADPVAFARTASAIALSGLPCARNAIISRIASCSPSCVVGEPLSPRRKPNGILLPR